MDDGVYLMDNDEFLCFVDALVEFYSDVEVVSDDN